MLLEINPAEWKTSPFPHQVVGVKFLLKNPVSALFDEMGSGKTKQFIDASSILWRAKFIDTKVIVAPSNVKTTWDREIEAHGWVPAFTEEYSGANPKLSRPGTGHLHYIITNYEFLRVPKRLDSFLLQLRDRRISLVFDESSYIKSHRAAQTKAAKVLRRLALRAYLCNGSPINNSLIDLYAPFAVLDKSIIGSSNYWAFRNRYCVMGGYQNKQIISYQHVEELQEKLKPYVLRRLKEDCLDLPPKLYNTVDVPLTAETWRVYKQVRDEMISWLDAQTPLVTMSAIVKIVRLSQLTSGMAGGLNRTTQLMFTLAGDLFQDREEELEKELDRQDIRIISTEKHKYVADWFDERVQENPQFRCILWTRFRKEQELLRDLLAKYKVLRIFGGQNKAERESVLQEFNTPSLKPVVLLGQPRAGGIGLNLQAECSWAVYVSNDYSLLTRQQSEDRIHRAGQRASVVNYLDLLATGPQGQKTIDHAILKALQKKDALAMRTTAYWRAAIAAE